ncbi:MAG: hypothetical protein K2X91_12535, partial [Thermoleophilia bacterium]|nr:hypothetical protein [Thermoleophilia bacterium]
EFRDKVRQHHDDDPTLLAPLLDQTRHGVDWKLAEWARLSRALDEHGYWHYDERYAALKLAGHRPEDVLRDALVERMTLACNRLHPEAWALWDECHQAALGLDDRPMYLARILALEARRPATPEAALEQVWAFVDAEVARLEALKADGLDARAASDRADAAEAALIDDGPGAPLMLRYEANAERALFKALAELAKLQKARGTDRGEYVPEPIPEPVPAAEPPPAPKPPARPKRVLHLPPTPEELDALAEARARAEDEARARVEAERLRRIEEDDSPEGRLRRSEARFLAELEQRHGIRASRIVL